MPRHKLKSIVKGLMGLGVVSPHSHSISNPHDFQYDHGDSKGFETIESPQIVLIDDDGTTLNIARVTKAETPPANQVFTAGLYSPQPLLSLDKRDNKVQDHEILTLRPAKTSLVTKTPYSVFRDTVNMKMNKQTIGFRSDPYLTEVEQSALVSETQIWDLFKEASDFGVVTMDFVQYIVSKAPATFLTTVLTMDNANYTLCAMYAFCRHGFTDSDLPIQNSDQWPCNREWECQNSGCPTCEDGGLIQVHCDHDQVLDAFHHSCWNFSRFTQFYDLQWRFCLLRIDPEKFQYDSVDNKRILPVAFAPDEESGTVNSMQRAGNFSEVRSAWILADYINNLSYVGLPPPDSGWIRVAIKSLRQLDEPGYVVYDEWQKEAAAQKAMNELKDPHIVKGLGAVRQAADHRLILEWANGGSLRDLWNTHQNPEFTGKTVLDLLRQLRGLAKALWRMHVTPKPDASGGRNHSRSPSIGTEVTDFAANSTRMVPYTRSAGVVNPLPSILVDKVGEPNAHGLPPLSTTDASRRSTASGLLPGHPLSSDYTGPNWRHGDIKPENILCFIDEDLEEEGTLQLGTFKLADLGRAKQNMNPTHIRSEKDFDMWHTKTYEPPDVSIGKDTSRLYDIWSLGCVFFEAEVWILYGQNQILSYKTASFQQNRKGSFYWTSSGVRDGDARVSQTAAVWMNYILNDDPECKARDGSSALRDLMLLIRDEMLVVDLRKRYDHHQANCRVNAERVYHELDRIVKKAEAEPTYLTTGHSRHDVLPPPSSSGQDTSVSLGLVQSPIVDRGETIPNGFANMLNLPKDTARSAGPYGATTTALRRLQYTNPLDDIWSYERDDAFAQTALNAMFPDEDAQNELYAKSASKLCAKCKTFDPSDVTTFQKRPLREVNGAAAQCRLCKLLLSKAKAAKINMATEISIKVQGGRIKINDKDDITLRVCRSPGQLCSSQLNLGLSPRAALSPRDAEATEKENHNGIPIGLPKLPDGGDESHLALIRAWLNDCDEHKCVPDGIKPYCPRRLLYLGALEEPECRLVETANLPDRDNLRYIALSHPWGDEKAHRHFKSTAKNINSHMRKLDESALPQNFQDAVGIARGVGYSYLWIDSICIRQASGSDEGDFYEEAEHMQDIFSSAYCVFAASSAEGMQDGFLNREDTNTVVLKPVRKDGRTTGNFYISTIADDFEHDVEQSNLSKRGWVLQERALARRTIYFTKHQTYFECGQGVRCETLSKIRSQEAAFLGDPDFPRFGTHKDQTMGAQLYLFRNLYKDYSRLDFTRAWDKPVAIAGLEQRLTKHFTGSSGAGIFAKHAGRFLLWERAEDYETLGRIDFPVTSAKTPPSWSWMSFTGGIDYLEPTHGMTSWNKDISLILTGDGTTSWLYAKQSISMTAPVLQVDESAQDDIAKSLQTRSPASQRSKMEISLTLDIPNRKEPQIKYFVTVGTHGREGNVASRTYVLAVRWRPDQEAFERIGAGWIPHGMIERATRVFDSSSNTIQYLYRIV